MKESLFYIKIRDSLEKYIDKNYIEPSLDKKNISFSSIASKPIDKDYECMPLKAPTRKKSGGNFVGRILSKHQKDADNSYAKTERDYERRLGSAPMADAAICMESEFAEAIDGEKMEALEERMRHLSDTFQEYLLYLIERKGMKNSDVYNRAVITKQVFSKIKTNPDYHPDKSTAMRLCVGAMLNIDETKDLLARAGYALSPCDKTDIIFSFFIENEVFDMIEIDIALEDHGLKCFIG